VDPAAGAPDPQEGDDSFPAGADRPGADWPDGPPEGQWPGEEDGPFFAWLPPEDRLWRHPSEAVAGGAATARRRPPDPPPPGGGRWLAVIPRSMNRNTAAVALIAGIVGAVAATGVGMASGLWPRTTTVVRPQVPSTSAVSLAAVGPQPTDWTAVLDSVAPSVVAVSVDGAAGPQEASGLVFMQAIDGEVFVVTDRAVLARGEEAGYIGTIDVTFPSGLTTRAHLVGEDRLSNLAVLEVTGVGMAVPASLGSVSTLNVADTVLAVGSRTASSVATGTVSAEDRTITLTDGSDLDDLLAVTMSPLAGAAAGGPLMNPFGQVVGVTISVDPIDSNDAQLTFAVPVDEMERVATQLIDQAQVTHPWLGLADMHDLPTLMARQMGLIGGVQVGSVAPGSPASVAGVRPNDVVTAIDGKSVASTGALVAAINSCSPGHAVPLSYVHGGRTINTRVRPSSEPQDS
jgi:putative serine protease PepD